MTFFLNRCVIFLAVGVLCGWALPPVHASTAGQDVATYTQWINANPNDANLYHGRGDAYLYLKQYTRAEHDYSSALELNPNNANALYSRGLANSCLGKTHCALMDFGKSLTLNPKDADAHYNRGIVRVKEGDVSGAMFDYTRAIELNPEHAYAYYNRGMLYATWPKRSNLALADLAQAERCFTAMQDSQNIVRVQTAIQRLQHPATRQATLPSSALPTLR